ECVPTPPGRRTAAVAVAPGGRTAWTADSDGTTITAHRVRDLARRRTIDVGGAPVALALSPDGTIALAATAFYDHPGLAVVDLATGEVDRVEAGPQPSAVAFAATGRRACVVSGGPEGALRRVDVRTRRVHAPVALGPHPRGVAVTPDGRHALAAVNGAASVALVDLAAGRVVRQIATPPFPAQVAVSPDGRRALVTHDGFGARAVTLIDLRRGRVARRITVGPEPGGVAFTPSGAGALVTAAGMLVLLDTRTWRARRTVRRLGRPRAVAVGPRQAVVADGATGQLRAVALGALR
ncbi:MAG TPA: hypothetical protein VD931_04810, partial [Baekduia sp.]|nr:hypothetical protein [Baekduia sp.]